MVIEWKINTLLPDVGRVSVEGKREQRGGKTEVVFYHPSDDGALILSITEERLEELYSMSAFQRSKLNFSIERREVFVGKHSGLRRNELEQSECPDCGDIVTMIDKDFLVHSLPQCDGWNRRNQR